jgi:import inner membrane translocase subunit TIM21
LQPRAASLLRSALTSSPSSSSSIIRSSSGGGYKGNGQSSSSTSADGDRQQPPPPTSQEIVLTPGEKVVVGTRLFFWSAAFAFASVCGYYIIRELMPTKMSPNAVFDGATDIVRNNEEVKRRFGDSIKTYGRDHGGHREGRRNFVEHTEYVDAETDGSKRTRVRFNLEGQYGSAFVFAEVASSMPSGEFVYVLVQDKRNGATITVVDNRSMLLARKMAGGSDEGRDVFARLLGTGGGGK